MVLLQPVAGIYSIEMDAIIEMEDLDCSRYLEVNRLRILWLNNKDCLKHIAAQFQKFRPFLKVVRVPIEYNFRVQDKTVVIAMNEKQWLV